MKIPKWLRVTLASALLLLVLSVASLWTFVHFMFGDDGRCKGHERFEPAIWHDSTKAFGPMAVRGCIVDDLLAKRDFHGRSRAEVVSLLGEPRPTEYFKEYDLVYWLGPERGLMSIDSEWLVFRVDSLGRVADYLLVTD